MKIRLLILAFTFAFLGRSAFGDDALAQANQEYAAGGFHAAIDHYQRSLNEGAVNATAFYNLGNAHFRVNDFGHAILNYERALALEPHHPEAEANLRLARDKAHALELKRDALQRLTSPYTATQFALVASLVFWIAAFSLALLLLSRRRSVALSAVFLLSLLSLAACIYGLYLRETGSNGRALAIVTAKGTDARLATADSAQTVLTLPAGSEIKILNTRGDWTYAELPNDLRGWIPALNAERVRL